MQASNMYTNNHETYLYKEIKQFNKNASESGPGNKYVEEWS